MRIRALGALVSLSLALCGSVAVAQTPPPPTLQIYTKPIEPFSFERGGKAAGFSIELWERVAQKLGVKYELHWEKSVGDLIIALKEKRADVAIAAISITAEREKQVDFSTPFYESGLGILVRAQGKSAMDIISETFFTRSMARWLLLLLGVLVVCAHFIWVFERIHNADQFPKPYARGIWESSWWAISTILSGGCDAKGPNAVLGRVFGAVWMFVCIVVLTYLTATITTVMTVSQLTSDISGPNDLPGKKVATLGGTTAETYLKSHGVKVTAVEKLDQAYDLLEKKQVVAVVYDEPILAYHVNTSGVAGQRVVGLFQRQNYGIGLQEGSSWRKPVNRALLELAEEGVIEELRAKWFGD
jgi:ABC-type amino acid transport substrate-binding protein